MPTMETLETQLHWLIVGLQKAQVRRYLGCEHFDILVRPLSELTTATSSSSGCLYHLVRWSYYYPATCFHADPAFMTSS
jgi:hypothetical protein